MELRRVTRADGAALVAAHVESVALHSPWVMTCLDDAAFAVWFDTVTMKGDVALVAREDGAVVGVIRFSQIFLGNFRSAYLAYYGMAGMVGRGLMTQALRQAVRIGFGEIGLHRVEANVQPENERSIALLRRVGFRKEGFSPRYLRIGGDWRDHERWALLADEMA